MLMQFSHYRFQPKLIPTLATFALVPVLVSLGLWQSGKADQKQALQDMYDQRAAQFPLQIPSDLLKAEEFHFRNVTVRGRFETKYQILLDNQLYDGKAGYHVITPLQIGNSNIYVLVNRGWVPLGSDRSVLPNISTPEGVVEVVGVATLPPSKFLELMKPESLNNGWQTVWQNIDLKRYREAVPFQLQPIIIQLNKDSPSGFVCEWPRPASRIEKNLGYAFQWFGMAVVLVLFYILTNLKRISDTETASND